MMCTFLSAGDLLLLKLSMAVVIRLQGLPDSAGTADIRWYFQGLFIPKGGVHIIGGTFGEAFIVFASDEHARLAVSRSGGIVQGSRINLFLSSRAEMNSAIEMSHKLAEEEAAYEIDAVVNQCRSAVPNCQLDSTGNNSNMSWCNSGPSCNSATNSAPCKPTAYLFVCGMPESISEHEIKVFFHKLNILEVILLINVNGQTTGDFFVKLSSPQDATEAVMRGNGKQMGSRILSVAYATESQWIAAGGRVGVPAVEGMPKMAPSHSFPERYSPSQSWCQSPKTCVSSSCDDKPKKAPRYSSSKSYSQSRSRSRSPKRYRSSSHDKAKKAHRHSLSRSYSRSRSRSRSPRKYKDSYLDDRPKKASKRSVLKNYSRSRSQSRSPKKYTSLSRSCSPRKQDFYIRMKHLIDSIEKRDIKKFFKGAELTDDQIRFLYNEQHRKTEAFVTFKKEIDYFNALCRHKEPLNNCTAYIFPISKKAMLDELKHLETTRKTENRERKRSVSHAFQKNCLYVRNLPCDVSKNDVKQFFYGFDLSNNDIHLLCDTAGVGLGEALVQFRSEDEAAKAELLNRKTFLETEVLLRLITKEQMKKLSTNILPELPKPSPSLSDSAVNKTVLPQSGSYCSQMISFPEVMFQPHQHEFLQNAVNVKTAAASVKLENLPFMVNFEEVFNFFHGYHILPESLTIQSSLDGTEAVIILRSYEEAVAAVQQLNGRPLGKNKIRVSLV
ncbi:RNA-binding protein 12B-A-like [Protopterus annectens]|uniref:RNA-binding protein 12B-A-like n=1 Tax=Protopterus annectens TaxID=7888 RepID=UPI001CFA3CD8|nr:RNA-binding protein 12B-A-like [Protopterus annectens]